MSWNYRVFKKKVEQNKKTYIIYDMHEVYYDENGKINGWTADPIIKGFESLDDMQETLKMMMKDVKRNPVLEEETLLHHSKES